MARTSLKGTGIEKERGPIDAYIRSSTKSRSSRTKELRESAKISSGKAVSKDEFNSLLAKSKGMIKNNIKTQFVFQ